MLKVALVGRPNVGKSTLFNALLHSRDALVADEPGMTRDRNYGAVDDETGRFLLIDTGGITFGKVNFDKLIFEQTNFAMQEAELVCLVVDAKEGLTPLDLEIIAVLRRKGKPFWLLINKMDGRDQAMVFAEFSSLNIDTVFYVAAIRKHGIKKLRQALGERLGEQPIRIDPQESEDADRVRVTFFGRPNVGKSTLINCLLGEQRLLSFDTPGTTRDSIAVDFSYGGDKFSLVDTAGIRRRKLEDGTEKLSVLRALESALMSDVVVLVCDAGQGIGTQEATLASRALSAGCALVIAVNKKDLIQVDNRQDLKRSIDLTFQFLSLIPVCFVSATRHQGIKPLLKSIRKSWQSARVHLATPQCTRLLQKAVQRHQPPLVAGRRIKLRYAHQGGTCPPRFIIYGSRVEKIPAIYRRYLQNYFCQKLKLVGTPVILEFRQTTNPYVEEV